MLGMRVGGMPTRSTLLLPARSRHVVDQVGVTTPRFLCPGLGPVKTLRRKLRFSAARFWHRFFPGWRTMRWHRARETWIRCRSNQVVQGSETWEGAAACPQTKKLMAAEDKEPPPRGSVTKRCQLCWASCVHLVFAYGPAGGVERFAVCPGLGLVSRIT